jgi:hypothetical protein
MMANWLVKTTPGNSSAPLSSKVSEISPSNTILPSCECIQAPTLTKALDCHLEEQISKYQSSPKKIALRARKQKLQISLGLSSIAPLLLQHLKLNRI